MKTYALFCLSFALQMISGFNVDLIPIEVKHTSLCDMPTSIFDNVSLIIPTLKLCFGTPTNQCFNLILDNESPATYIMKGSEKSSSPHLFNNDLSSTYEPYINETFHHIYNGIYFIHGNISKDHIQINKKPKQQETKFSFLLITSFGNQPTREFDFDGFYGIKKYHNDQSTFYRTKYSLMKYLLHAGEIDRERFMFSYYPNGNGEAIFGGSDTDYNSYGNTCDATDTQTHWNCNFTHIAIGNEVLDEKIKLLFDSTLPYIIASSAHGGLWIQHIIIKASKGKCKEIKEDNANRRFLICDENTPIEKFPDIIMKTQEETVLTLQWKYLFKLTSIDEDNHSIKKYVSLFICDNALLDWSIGIPGFIGQSYLFDIENLRIGIKQLNGPMSSNTTTRKVFYNFTMVLLICGIVINVILIQQKGRKA